MPELIYVNLQSNEERQIVRNYVDATGGLLLNIFEIEPVLKKKASKGKAEPDKLETLTHVVFRNLNKSQIIFTDFPLKPEEFFTFEHHNRQFKLFADYVKPQHYQFSKSLNSSIYFLETLRRRQIESDFPFESQINNFSKYVVLTGPPCAGKTSAAKFICSEFGYRHIEY